MRGSLITAGGNGGKELRQSSVGRVYITALIGRTRRPQAVFPQYFEPFACAGLSLTGTGVGVSRFSTGESGSQKAVLLGQLVGDLLVKDLAHGQRDDHPALGHVARILNFIPTRAAAP